MLNNHKHLNIDRVIYEAKVLEVNGPNNSENFGFSITNNHPVRGIFADFWT